MIALRRIDHVRLRVADVAEASARWCAQFGLVERERDGDERARLACDDEPFCLELVRNDERGAEHVAYELRRSCSLGAPVRSPVSTCPITDEPVP